MAKRVRTIMLILENGDTKLIQVKTCTERYIWNVISDMWLPARVIEWKVV